MLIINKLIYGVVALFNIFGIIGGVSFLLFTVLQLLGDLAKKTSANNIDFTSVEELWRSLNSENFYSLTRSLKRFFSYHEYELFVTYILDTPVIIFTGFISIFFLFLSFKNTFKQDY